MYLADGIASGEVVGAYKPGDRHGMLIFIRQAVGAEYDRALAVVGAAEAGWMNFSIKKAGTLNAENLNGRDQYFRDAFECAMQGTCAIVVYGEPMAFVAYRPEADLG